MKGKKTRIIMLNYFAMIVFLGLGLIWTGTVFAEVMFIANNSVSNTALSKSEIKEIFLGDKVSWENGQEIKFVTLKKSATHQEFTKQFTKKSESQFLRYWKKQVFTGKGSMPKSFASEKELMSFVANNEGAIGYISKGTAAEGVKTLTISDN